MKPEAFDSALDDIEVRLERLIALYEQFLAGHERVDPVALQKDIGRRIVRLRSDANARGAAAARLRGVLERYENLQRYWERLSGRMKNGSHQRPLVIEREEPRALAERVSSGGADVERRLTPPLGTPAALEPHGDPQILPTSLRPPAPPADGRRANEHRAPTIRVERPVFEDDITVPRMVLKDALELMAHAETEPGGVADAGATNGSAVTPERVREILALLLLMNPDGPRVSLARLTTLLEDCAAKLRAQHGDRAISFDVVLKDGRGVIKPIVQ